MQNNAIQHLLRAKPLWQQITLPPSNQNQLGIAVKTQPQAIVKAKPSFNFQLALACAWATLLQSPIAFGIIAAAAVAELGFQFTKQPYAVARNWAYAILNGVLLAAYFLK
jgi:hypothetical protein